MKLYYLIGRNITMLCCFRLNGCSLVSHYGIQELN